MKTNSNVINRNFFTDRMHCITAINLLKKDLTEHFIKAD